MKKMLVIAMCAALAVTLAACGNSSSEETTETEEEVDAKEAADEVAEKLDEPGGTEDAEAGNETATYKGMTFSYPVDSTYEESGDIVNITIGDSEALILLMSMDLSTSDDEYNDEAVDILLEAGVVSSIEAYEDVQNESIEDLTVAGCPAKEGTAQVTINSVLMNLDCTSIYDEAGQYLYTVEYAARADAEGRVSDYQALLDSITFGGENVGEEGAAAESTEDNAEANGASENESALAHFDGYDILYQNYELFENSRGEVRLYAIVEVENTGSTNLQLRDGNFTFTDADGNLAGMASYSASKDPDIIKPGERGYFYLNDAKLDGDLSVNGGYIFEPELSFKETDKDPVVFEVSDTSISEGRHDKADVMGRITNPTDEDYDYLSIAVVLFDQSDNPIAVYPTTVKDLTAGGTSSFDAEATTLRDMSFSYSDVARYEVIASK